MPSRTIIETGCEPEYTVDDYGVVEYLRDGSVRIPVCSEWKGALRTEFFVRIRKEALARLGRRALEIAADSHNADQLAELVLGVAH